MLVACPIIPAQADLITTISGGWGPGGSAFASEPDGPLYFAFGNFNIDTFHFFNYVYDDYAFRTSDVGSKEGMEQDSREIQARDEACCKGS